MGNSHASQGPAPESSHGTGLPANDGALVRLTSRVLSVALSPDGGTIVSGAQDHTVRLWRLADGALLRTLKGHTEWVFSVAVSPDSATIVSGSRDRTVRLWRLADGALLRTLEGHTRWVFSVAVSPDGLTIVSGSRDKTVRLWCLVDGVLLRTLDAGNDDRVNSVAVSPDSATIVGSSGGTVRLWRAADGAVLRTMSSGWAVNSMAVSPDGATIVSGHRDGAVRVRAVRRARVQKYDCGGHEEELCLFGGEFGKGGSGHTESVQSVAVSPDGATIVTGSYDNTVRLWRLPVETVRLWRLAEEPVASVESGETPPCEVPVAATPSGVTATENELGSRASSPAAESIAKWLCAELGVYKMDAARLSAHLSAEGLDCRGGEQCDLLNTQLFPRENLEALRAHGLRPLQLKKLLRLQACARD